MRYYVPVQCLRNSIILSRFFPVIIRLHLSHFFQALGFAAGYIFMVLLGKKSTIFLRKRLSRLGFYVLQVRGSSGSEFRRNFSSEFRGNCSSQFRGNFSSEFRGNFSSHFRGISSSLETLVDDSDHLGNIVQLQNVYNRVKQFISKKRI